MCVAITSLRLWTFWYVSSVLSSAITHAEFEIGDWLKGSIGSSRVTHNVVTGFLAIFLNYDCCWLLLFGWFVFQITAWLIIILLHAILVSHAGYTISDSCNLGMFCLIPTKSGPSLIMRYERNWWD